MKETTRDLMIYALDNELTQEEAQRLELALQASADLRAEQRQLLAMRQLLAESQPEPSPVFVENIIAQLAKPPQTQLSTLIVNLYPQIAAACILAIAISLSAIYLTEGSLTLDALVGVTEVSLEDAQTWVEY